MTEHSHKDHTLYGSIPMFREGEAGGQKAGQRLLVAEGVEKTTCTRFLRDDETGPNLLVVIVAWLVGDRRTAGNILKTTDWLTLNICSKCIVLNYIPIKLLRFIYKHMCTCKLIMQDGFKNINRITIYKFFRGTSAAFCVRSYSLFKSLENYFLLSGIWLTKKKKKSALAGVA